MPIFVFWGPNMEIQYQKIFENDERFTESFYPHASNKPSMAISKVELNTQY